MPIKLKSAIFQIFRRKTAFPFAGLISTAALNVLQYVVIAFDVHNPPFKASEGRIPLKFITQ
jgi:hypothetical protein